MSQATKARVSIEYCPKCRWMLRAAWLGQELLTTFEEEIGELALIPGGNAIFQVKVNNSGNIVLVVVVWDRKQDGGFPEVKELKQRIRDLIAPHKSLGHSDRKPVKKEEEDCKTCPAV
ncbi:Rdx family-domain-containing protein [Phycomyces blakesleeanus]|uniref:Rdx family-domain-containing protein n=1 Tax=Phycomyces blakesleeanus TaxID=4837 RepID=A0ABR3AM14_PHYBL